MKFHNLLLILWRNHLEGLPWWPSGKESACQCRRCELDLWVRRSPGEESGNPLQDSCLGNPKYRGACQETAVHGVSGIGYLLMLLSMLSPLFKCLTYLFHHLLFLPFRTQPQYHFSWKREITSSLPKLQSLCNLDSIYMQVSRICFHKCKTSIPCHKKKVGEKLNDFWHSVLNGYWAGSWLSICVLFSVY